LHTPPWQAEVTVTDPLDVLLQVGAWVLVVVAVLGAIITSRRRERFVPPPEVFGTYVVRRPPDEALLDGWTVARADNDLPADWFIFRSAARRKARVLDAETSTP
jgi:hypothetical protein